MSKHGLDIDGYTIIKRLGTGARTKIYLAQEEATKQTVALKHAMLECPEDARIFEQLGLVEETEIAAPEFCRITRQRMGNLYDIWREVPHGDTDLRRENLMRGISIYLGESG